MNNELYAKFKAYLKEMQMYGRTASLYYWDLSTATPKKGVQGTVDAYTFFNMKQYNMSVADEYGKMLEELSKPENLDGLTVPQQFTIKKRLKDYEEYKRVPADFYEKKVREQAITRRKWEEARNENDFSIVSAYLKKNFENMRTLMAYKHPGMDPYDALISESEEGLSCEVIDPLFDEVKKALQKLIPAIMAKEEPDSSIFTATYDTNHQVKISKFLLDYMGFDLDAGVVSESAHPFTMGLTRNDVRMTNHYREDTVIDPMFSIIHEGGHGIFEQGVSADFEDEDCEHIGHAALHESQSRFYENILGRNKNFWVPIYEKIQEMEPNLKDISLDQFYREINHIRPSFVRTMADEVTYCMHIILRHEMEKVIFSGDFDVNELPKMWDDKMEELLGVRPTTVSEGILQDMHWFDGFIGYFPTYLLGSIYDGMFYESLKRDLGDVDAILRNGEIKKITAWLRENIHQYGGLYNSMETLSRVYRKPVSAKPLIQYFEEKYKEIYEL